MSQGIHSSAAVLLQWGKGFVVCSFVMAIQTCSLFHRAVNKGERRIPPLSTLCFKAVNLSSSLHLAHFVLYHS